MPRKPSSVFLIAEDPTTTTHQDGMPPTQLKAWRLPLDGDMEGVVEAHYQAQPIGTTLFVVEDTKVAAFTVGLTLNEVDDPRLDQQNEPESPDAHT